MKTLIEEKAIQNVDCNISTTCLFELITGLSRVAMDTLVSLELYRKSDRIDFVFDIML